MPRCDECDKKVKKDAIYRWLDAADTLSPQYCRTCYLEKVENWKEGEDVEEIID